MLASNFGPGFRPPRPDSRPDCPDPHIHLPPPLLFAVLCAAGILLAGIIYIKFNDIDRRLAESVSSTAGLSSLESKLRARLAELETASLSDRTIIEKRIKEISDKQAAAAIAPPAETARAPFALEATMKAVVEIVCLDNTSKDVYYTASGTVVDKSGLIVTNRHVLLSDDGSVIGLCGIGFTNEWREPPKVEYIAKAIAVHEADDLAVLRIIERMDRQPLPTEFPTISLVGAAAAAGKLQLGDQIYIGGYPDVGADTFTFTQGVVSGRLGTNYIKTTALIDSGASGGAGFDSAGHFIGVPTAAAKGEIGGSLGYLIGADIVDAFLMRFFSGQK
ncbi:hypothetical protein A3C96_02430 [Candidatus Uhrbacteria bacterium RIFCSPHIGHO2_02_FULL_60_10]|uniref:Serine protease n=1 Tax=Candidatus Uhrbacteria bacterium RIFCSPHIGHO2_02_FULL_60_10 TaxID=1802392 RepID=A0A1F7U3Q9_9BACT|nr:MAG: hypothetical protein A3C96_02430 [Candidatus Uhrbacteria bacterium RIFCSPHIGHO2_02_FULL_60_10]